MGYRKHMGLPCKVDGCEKSMASRGLCVGHFRKWHKAKVEGIGKCDSYVPDPVPLPFTDEEKLFNSIRKIDQNTGCWLGPWSPKLRYSSITLRGVRRLTHRAMYEVVVGPIPEGLELDHLCQTPRCVNPKHLQPVTSQENKNRAAAARQSCKHGHKYETGNFVLTSKGVRKCLICSRAADKQRSGSEERKKAKSDAYARKVGKL